MLAISVWLTDSDWFRMWNSDHRVLLMVFILVWFVQSSRCFANTSESTKTSPNDIIMQLLTDNFHNDVRQPKPTNGIIIFNPAKFNMIKQSDENENDKNSILGVIDLNSSVFFWANLTQNQVDTLLESDDIDAFYAEYGNDNAETNNENDDYFDSFAIMDFWPGQLILISLYSIAAFLSLSLNIITIFVWFFGERSQSKEIWHLLVNLSMADIGMAIFCIPFTYTNVMLQQWIFPVPLCGLVNFFQLCFVFVSVWTLTFISVDRYFAIIHPLYKFSYRKTTVLAIIWLVGLLFASSQLFISTVEPYKNGKYQLFECVESWSNELFGQIYTITVFILTFLLPVSIITLAYSQIWHRMVNHVTPGNPDTVRDSHQVDVKHKVFTMLTMVVGLFILCWLPIHIFNLVIYFAPNILEIDTQYEHNIYYITFFCAHFLSMVHSLMNPIVYCFMSENFRQNLLSFFPRISSRFKRCDSESLTRAEMGLPAANDYSLRERNNSTTRQTSNI